LLAARLRRWRRKDVCKSGTINQRKRGGIEADYGNRTAQHANQFHSVESPLFDISPCGRFELRK
jgi:hypothetical protein